MISGKEVRAEIAKERPRPGVEGWRKEGKPVPNDPRNRLGLKNFVKKSFFG